MADPAGSESLAWGTLEELLLACAVHRYGTDCWDSVAKAIQKRSSGTFHLFTSQRCKQKYSDLKRRFAAQADDSGSAATDGDAFPWLDELRRRRIAELKRELERYDLSIVSLQSTVKRLSEERDKSLTENEREVSDLRKTEHREGGDGQREEEEDRTETPSVNASNTSDPKGAEKSGEIGGEVAGETNPVDSDPEEATEKAAGEDSYNGSSDTIAAEKGAAGYQELGSAKTEPVYDSPELVESVAESKREEEEERVGKEASEVQSCVWEKKGRGKTIGSENHSVDAKPVSVKSQPMADFLDVIRRHKFGSVFERRLDSQVSSKYKNMVRQHMDLATVKARLEEGQYAECPSKFHRDLLLVATNAALFFPKRSPEHKAAIELRRLVSSKLPRHPPPPRPTTQLAQPKLDLETPYNPPAGPIPALNPKLINPVIVCRKRSSVVMKPVGGEKKRADEKEKLAWFGAVTKKRTRDQGSSGPKLSGNKSFCDKDKDNNINTESSGVVKKKSVASFLNRIQKIPGYPSESSKNPKSNNKGGGKDKGSKSEGPGKEKGKQKEGTNEEGSKRNVGRPPKRAAAVAGAVKRRRDSGGGGGDKAEGGAPKKRARK